MASGGGDRQKGIEELEQEVICPVCHDHFQEPKILPCLHYYCKQCIQALAWRAGANQPFPCPECRIDTILPQNDPAQLPTAFFINRMKEVHAKLEKVQGKVEAKCEMCPGEIATAFCRQCAGFICEKCTESHHRMKTFAEHEVLSMEDLKEGGGRSIATKPPPPPICQVHDEQAKIYCFDCKTLICRDCVVFDHKDHKCEFVKKAIPKVKDKLLKGIVSLRDVQITVRDAANNVKEMKVKIGEQGEVVAASIRQSFETFRKVLDEHEQELLVKASTAVEKKIERLAVQEESMNVSYTTIQSLIDFVEKNIANATEEELVSQHSQLLHRMKDAGTKVQNLKPMAKPDMQVNMVSIKELKQFCQLKADVFIPTYAVHVEVEDKRISEVGKVVKVKVQPKNPQTGNLEINFQLMSTHNGVVTLPKVVERIGEAYKMKFLPTVRGYHVFQTMADGLLVPNNSAPIFVEVPPAQLGEPVKIIDMIDSPRGIAIKSTGEILVTTPTTIVALNKNGEKFSVLASSDQYNFFGIAVDQDDYIYVSESNQGDLLKLNSRGEIIKVYSTHTMLMPRGVTVHKDEVYLCNSGNGQVHVVTKELVWKRNIVPCSLKWPSEVVVDTDGQTVYICDHQSNQIWVYSYSRKYNGGVATRVLQRKLSQPCAICVSGSLVFVSEWGENRVSVLTKDGQLVTTFGHGRLMKPSRIAVDSNGFVYVCDTGNNRVQVF